MASVFRGPVEAQPRRRRPSRDAEAQNWLLSTAPQTQPPPFLVVDLFDRARPRRARADDLVGPNVLLFSTPPVVGRTFDDFAGESRRRLAGIESAGVPILLLTPSPAVAIELSQPDRRPIRLNDEAPNLLLGTFSIVAQAVLPFASGEWPIRPAKRYAQADGWPNVTLQTLGLIPASVLPFASGEWPKAPPRRFGTLTEAPNLAISTLALAVAAPPFAPIDLTQPARRRLRTDDVQTNLQTSLLPARPLVALDLTQTARRRLAQAETTVNALTGPLKLPPPVVLPFPSGEWLHAKVKLHTQADGWPNLTLTTLGLPSGYSIIGKRSTGSSLGKTATASETHRMSGDASVTTIKGDSSSG